MRSANRCFQFVFVQRSKPSGLRGPAEAPPCMRHFVYFLAFLLRMAGARHGAPERVFAPQRGDLDGSPGRAPLGKV